MARPQLWFEEEGLRFRCTQCGDCCKRPGFVFLTPFDAHRIAQRLLGDEAVAESLVGELWVQEPDGTFRIDVPIDAVCPLLGDNGACKVHDIKPMQCATYPFWEENVATPGAWALEQSYCEGIRSDGDVYSMDAIADLLVDQARTRE